MHRESSIVSAVLFSASPFLDGFITVAAGFLIASFLMTGSVTAVQVSLFAGSFMTGTFLGSGLIGRVADRFGRLPCARTLVPALFPLSAAALLFSDITSLTVINFVLGVLIGADQPVSQALAAEKLPLEKRGRVLSLLMLAWFVGALTAVGLYRLFLRLGLTEAALYAVPALIALANIWPRLRLTESDVWKASVESAPKGWGLAAVLRRSARSFVFCCGFWICQTIPVTAIMFYSPTILASMTGSNDQTLQIALIYLFFLLGTLPMTTKLFSPPLSRVLVGTFAVMAVGLAGVALSASSAVLLGLFFVAYAFAYGMQTTLDYIYPVVLFSPSLRASASGAILAVSRVGSALCAVGFPFLLERFDAPTLLLAGAIISAAGMGWVFCLPQKDR